MPDESLVEIYRAGDMVAAAFLTNLLQERGLPVLSLEAGLDGLPRVYFGTLGYRIMMRRDDAEAHADEIAAAIKELEETLDLPRHA
jgi:hypothetical protein